MLEGIDVEQRIEFSSKEDTGDKKTVFVFKPVTGYDAISGKEHEDPTINSLLKSIVEIRDFKGATDKQEILMSLAPGVLGELIDEMNRINSSSDEDKKKL